MIQEALTVNGRNYVADSQEVVAIETVELSSIMDKTDLLRFALQNSECSKLKHDLIEFLKA